MRAKAVGARLKAIREAHNLIGAKVADMLGVERTYWSRWETGTRPIPVDIAYQITTLFEVDLDFIYLGDLRSVPPELQSKLLEFHRDQTEI